MPCFGLILLTFYFLLFTSYLSPKGFGKGDDFKEFSIEAGDYLTQVSGTWGQQSPNHPKEAIISIQFQTHNGVTSGVFGGESPHKQVEPFAFTAPNGYAICGFFGATGRKDILARLGIYLQPIEELSLEKTTSTQGTAGMSPESVTAVATSSTSGDRQDNVVTSSEKGMGAQLTTASSINAHVPAPGARTSSGTGLEDYAYWLQEIAKEQAAKAGQEKKPFRRGRIWA
ncbi:MAG: cyanobactin biosynthesis PatC/TenC/TruC family protein [Cyanobacteria bacterium P01_D01_bin.50]